MLVSMSVSFSISKSQFIFDSISHTGIYARKRTYNGYVQTTKLKTCKTNVYVCKQKSGQNASTTKWN